MNTLFYKKGQEPRTRSQNGSKIIATCLFLLFSLVSFSQGKPKDTLKIAELKEHLSKGIKTIQDPATKVKVEEIAKHLVELDKTTKVNDDHLVDLMQYYELVQEIKKSNGV